MNALKNEITEFIKQALNLPDNAVITRGSVQINDQDEVLIIGSTAVEFQDKSSEEEYLGPEASMVSTKARTKMGKSKKEKSSYVSKAAKSERAIEGKGKEITEAQIKGWRIVLGIRERTGQLSAPQIAALKETKGIHAGKMSPEQKQQIKDIHEDTNPKRF